MEVFWFVPTAGDERYLTAQNGRREASFSYLKQIATALDSLGYEGALLPTGIGCEDSWVTAAALIPSTRHLRFLVAVRPAVMLPAISARMAASLDVISEGRLLINVVTGSGEDHLAAEGVFGDHDRRYEITDEFLTVWKELMGGDPVNFDGQHFKIRSGRLWPLPVQRPYPPLFFGGSSASAVEVASRHADVYLTWGEPPDLVREKIETVRRLAALQGRTIRFGIRLHVVVRETERQAWDAADELLKYVTDDKIAAIQTHLTANNSEGQRRMQKLHGGKRDSLEVSPNLWAGIGLVRPGAGTALVGDPAIIAERLIEYSELGIDTFILSGYPHLEEAYRFAELVFPLIPIREKRPDSSEATRSYQGRWSSRTALQVGPSR